MGAATAGATAGEDPEPVPPEPVPHHEDGLPLPFQSGPVCLFLTAGSADLRSFHPGRGAFRATGWPAALQLLFTILESFDGVSFVKTVMD